MPPGAPVETCPGELAPDALAPGELAPGELTPGELAPGELTPGELAPAALTPALLEPVPDDPFTPTLTELLTVLPERQLSLAADASKAARDKAAAPTNPIVIFHWVHMLGSPGCLFVLGPRQVCPCLAITERPKSKRDRGPDVGPLHRQPAARLNASMPSPGMKSLLFPLLSASVSPAIPRCAKRRHRLQGLAGNRRFLVPRQG